MTKNQNNELAEACGWAEDKRIDDIKLSIRASEYDKDKENAIHRKTFKIIIDKLIKGERLTYEDVSEFMKYNDDIESIKAEVDGK